MIPKVIHYCWFGRNPLPALAVKCLDSWKKFLPEYEIREWNEDNFPVDEFRFAKEALESRKFAFVSDVCRLWALKEFGGIYMDIDVEVLKPIDAFLSHTAFSGFEDESIVPTGIMGSIKGGKWVIDLLAYYDNRSFYLPDGSFNVRTNTMIITEIMVAKGFKMDNSFQDVPDYVTFYPKDFFCPKSYITGQLELTENTHTIHHFAKSWIAPHKKWRNTLKIKMMNIFGYKNVQKLIDLVKK